MTYGYAPRGLYRYLRRGWDGGFELNKTNFYFRFKRKNKIDGGFFFGGGSFFFHINSAVSEIIRHRQTHTHTHILLHDVLLLNSIIESTYKQTITIIIEK